MFAGAAVVTEHASKLGLVVGPPIELSISEELNVKLHHVLSWITYMLVEGFLDSCMVEPPCTTFSIMRSPPLRGKKAPFGYNVLDPQTSWHIVAFKFSALEAIVAALAYWKHLTHLC